MFSQFQCLIVDRNAGAVESLSLSRQITSGNKLTLFVALLLVGLLVIATGLPPAIALFAAVALSSSGHVLVGMFMILPAMLIFGVGFLFGVGPFAALLHGIFYLAMSGQTTADQLRYDAWQNPPPPTPPPPMPGA